MLPKSHITKPGSIAHHYTISGVMTVLLVEVKNLYNQYEQLDHYAQVIAEPIDISFIDSQRGFQLPVMGILTDADNFQFFKFESGKGQAPRFTWGKLCDGINIMTITKSSITSYTVQRAVLDIRTACEYLYSVSLSVYRDGVTAHWNHEVQRSN